MIHKIYEIKDILCSHIECPIFIALYFNDGVFDQIKIDFSLTEISKRQ